MVNTSDSIRLIEDSVIHPSVLLILIRFFKKTIKLYCIPKDKSRVKKPKHFIQNWVFIEYPAYTLGFPGGSMVKNQPAKQQTRIQSLSQENSLEEEMATHSTILAWKIPWRGAWRATIRGVTESAMT